LSLIFLFLFLFLFFLDWWPLCCFNGIFSLNCNFVPHLFLYVFVLFFT
jgi:hypothetical protein